MSLVNELRKRFNSMEVKGQDEEQRNEQIRKKKHERKMSDMAARKPETILGLSPMYVKMLCFQILKSISGNGKGAFLHTLQVDRPHLPDDESLYDGLDYLASELKIRTDPLRNYGKEHNIPLGKALASLVARAMAEKIIIEYNQRDAQVTVVRHALSHVHGTEAETVVNPGEKLDQEIDFLGYSQWKTLSNNYLLNEKFGILNEEKLKEHIENIQKILIELRNKSSTQAARKRALTFQKIRPSIRSKFLLMRSEENPNVKIESDAIFPINVHPDNSPSGDDSINKVDVSTPHGETPFKTWTVPRYRCHYCDDKDCNVEHSVKVGKRLGAGTSGIVYAAKWQNEDVALKIYGGMGDDNEQADQFLDELDIMNRCHHPNTMSLMGACISPPNYCMVMSLARHGTLYDLLHEKKYELSEKQCIDIALLIAKSLLYLHARLHLMHRDVKSLNIMLDGNDENEFIPRIADFGSAAFLRPSEMVKFGTPPIGTPVYMAPEVYKKLPYNFSADVFSYGILLAEMITGVEPYAKEIDEAGGNYEPVVERIVNDNLRPNIPDDHALSDLAKSCWSAELKDRPTFSNIVETLSLL